MESNKIKVSVIVAGQRFNIITDKSEKYVIDIASQIDARINSLCISGEMSRERAAVLTALDYADDSQLDKENIAAIKEQIKDYLAEIERLRDDNAKLTADFTELREKCEKLSSDSRMVSDFEKQAESDKATIDALKEEIAGLKEKLETLSQQAAAVPEAVEDREAPPEKEEPVITADDDLFFDAVEEEPVKPQFQPQKKKNRHEHSHVNPYKQNAEKKKEQKGYTQQRQYSFFDNEE